MECPLICKNMKVVWYTQCTCRMPVTCLARRSSYSHHIGSHHHYNRGHHHYNRDHHHHIRGYHHIRGHHHHHVPSRMVKDIHGSVQMCLWWSRSVCTMVCKRRLLFCYFLYPYYESWIFPVPHLLSFQRFCMFPVCILWGLVLIPNSPFSVLSLYLISL